MELDPLDRLNPEAEGCASARLARTRPASGPAPAARAAPSARTQGLLLATLIANGLTLALAAYGVETDRKSVAVVGLAATALAAVAVAAGARKSIRTGVHSREALDRALAGSERARDELRVAHERVQRRNADLQAFQLAVVQGFDLIDEQTQGRLKDLVEEAGDELAALVDDALDDPTEGA